MDKKTIGALDALKEQYLPLILTIIVIVLCLVISGLYNFDFSDPAYDKILDATINCTSILIGFVGVLIGVLFSIRYSKLIVTLFKQGADVKLKQYFLKSIISGVMLVVISAFLYLRYIQPINIAIRYLVTIWCGLLVYSGACYYRIIKLMIQIVFNHNEYDFNFSDTEDAKVARQKYTKH